MLARVAAVFFVLGLLSAFGCGDLPQPGATDVELEGPSEVLDASRFEPLMVEAENLQNNFTMLFRDPECHSFFWRIGKCGQCPWSPGNWELFPMNVYCRLYDGGFKMVMTTCGGCTCIGCD